LPAEETGDKHAIIHFLHLSSSFNGIWPKPSGKGDRIRHHGGGINAEGVTLASVEVFGCPGGESILVDEPLPIPLYSTAGIFYEEEEAVLVCGGESCDGNSCFLTNQCWKWSPQLGWSQAASMGMLREYHILAHGFDATFEDPNVYFVLGGGTTLSTEALTNLHIWEPHKQLPDYWSSFDLTQDGNLIYTVDGDQLLTLNLATWEIESLGEILEDYSQGRFTMTTIGGVKGIPYFDGSLVSSIT